MKLKRGMVVYSNSLPPPVGEVARYCGPERGIWKNPLSHAPWACQLSQRESQAIYTSKSAVHGK